MRKQLTYALAALLIGGAAVPDDSFAAPLTPAAPVSATLHAADADGSSLLKKRKRGKKRRSGHRRRR